LKTGKKISIKKLLKWSGSEPVHDLKNNAGPAKSISSISTDSRTLEKGDFFIPVTGLSFDGHDFIEEAVTRGCAGFVVDDLHINQLEKLKNKIGSLLWDRLIVLRSRDNISFLLNLSAGYIRQFNPIVIGITGSAGKTTTKDFIVNILKDSFNIKFTAKNYNTEIGIAASVLEVDEMTQFFIAELGMRAKGQIGMLSEVINLDMGVITAVGPSHLEFFDNVEEIALAKAEMAGFLKKKGGVLFLNNDDDWSEFISRNISCRIIRFGKGSGLEYNFIESMPDKMGFYSFDFYKKNKKLTGINMPVSGLHNVYNACCAAAVCSSLMLNPEMIKNGLENAELQENRMVVLKHDEMIIINDSYNANPLSMKRAIDTLKTISHCNKKRSVAILADMLELGPDAAILHRGIGKYLSENKIDLLVAYGSLSENICSGFSVCDGDREESSGESVSFKKKDYFYFEDKKQLCESLSDILKKDDVVLVKGSRANNLEDIIDYLLKA